MPFEQQQAAVAPTSERPSPTKVVRPGPQSPVTTKMLTLQRSVGNRTTTGILAASPPSMAAIQRRALNGSERDQLVTARERLSLLQVDFEEKQELLRDAMEIKGPIFNDLLGYLHKMKLDDIHKAFANAGTFFQEVEELAGQAANSDKTLGAFVRKLDFYEKSGGRNALDNAVGRLDKNLTSQERNDLGQITKLDEAYFQQYLAASKSPMTVYRGDGREVTAESFQNLAFGDVPAGGTTDISMFGVVQHTHTNTAKNGMVSTSTLRDVAHFWATETHNLGVVWEFKLPNYIHVANLLKKRNFKDRYPGQYEILYPGPIPADCIVSATLYNKQGPVGEPRTRV